jgi:phage shock protein PspC (stress-responsive transcriptional regulator)
MLAGVAAAIAAHSGLPVWLIRVAFVALFFWSGTGLVLYAAGWLLIPNEGDDLAVGGRWARSLGGSRSWLGLVLVVIAAAVLVDAVPFFSGGLIVAATLLVLGVLLYRGDIPGDLWLSRKTTNQEKGNGPDDTSVLRSDMTVSTSPLSEATVELTPPAPPKPPPPPSGLGQLTIGLAVVACGVLAIVDRSSALVDAAPRHYFALILTVIGAGLLIGAWIGRARWLILVGLILVPTTLGTAVLAVAEGRAGRLEELARPTTFAAVSPSYEKAAGELVIDLTDLPWNGEEVTITAEVGAGELELVLPPGVGVEATSEVGIGEIDTPFGNSGGISVDDVLTIDGDLGRVVADLSVGVGSLRIEAGNRTFPRVPPSPILPGENAMGDLTVRLSEAAALDPVYATTNGDITLDLSDVSVVNDQEVTVLTDVGDIYVVVPPETSHRIVATSELGAIDLFGEDALEGGGTVRSESITDGAPVITFTISTVDGDITIVQGERS